MTPLEFLCLWFVLSVPSSLFVGRVLAFCGRFDERI